jgi:hypothetical protein
VNHFLRNNITVTLQWPREAGADYHIDTVPEIPHTELVTNPPNTTLVINVTISYNNQYNISIVSIASLCEVTTITTKTLKYGKIM